jgi:ubiquinone/menaquinone biosynthesis C-methylase UbiE
MDHSMTTADHERKMLRKYRRLSLYYDPLFETLEKVMFGDGDGNPRMALAKKVPAGDLSVLDICTGTGRGALSVAESGCKVVGVDLSPSMLGVAEGKAWKRNVRNISFQQMDATRLELQDGQFDIAMISFALHEMEYDLILQVLREACRVLKRGGKLYSLDFEGDDNPWIQFVFGIYLRISYPPRVREFMRYDWSRILQTVGFRLDRVEKYRISKIVCATKTA